MTGLRNITLGRFSFAAPVGALAELLGSEVQATGDAIATGQRRVKGFTLSIALHGTPGDPDLYKAGQKQRRQMRALLQNHPLRLAGVYTKLGPDPERNGWLVIGTAPLEDAPGGNNFGEFLLNIDQVFKVASIATHRQGFRVAILDRRLATAYCDTLHEQPGIGVGFAGLPTQPLAVLPYGATDAEIRGARRVQAQRSSQAGALTMIAGVANGDVIAYERPESALHRFDDVVIWDRRGHFAPFYRPLVLADKPDAYWRLDETSGTTAADQTAAHPGTYTGGFTLNQPGALTPSGDTDASVAVDGSTGYVAVPGTPLSATNDFTVECWVKLSSLAAQKGQFVQNGDGTGGYGLGVGDGSGGAGTQLTALFSGVRWFDSGYAFTDTNWHHVAIVCAASTLTFYVDGVATSTSYPAVTALTPAGNSSIGQRVGTAGFFFNGQVDEVALYSHPLTVGQLAGHYGSGGGYGTAPDPETSFGWEEIPGPDYAYNWLTAGQPIDVPMIANGVCRVRYDGANTPGFIVDAWNGAAYIEQGKINIERLGDVGAFDATVLSATVLEWSPDRGVIQALMVSADGYSRERVLISLQRGWTGPRVEVYTAPKSDGTPADALIQYTPAGAADADDSAIKLDFGTAATFATAGSGSALYGSGTVGAGTFTGENGMVILRDPGAFQVTIAVIQAGAAATVGHDSIAYGAVRNTFRVNTAGGAGYLSARFGYSPQPADQINEAEAIRNGSSGTTSQVTDVAASGGGQCVFDTQTSAAANTLAKSPTSLVAGKYRCLMRVKVDSGLTGNFNLNLGGAATPTVTTTSSTWTWIDLGDAVATAGGNIAVAGWRTGPGLGGVYIDRLELIKLEDTATYDGARDLGHQVLLDLRPEPRAPSRA